MQKGYLKICVFSFMLSNFPAIKPVITNPGTISLRTNMIRVSSNPTILHQYAVKFEPAVAKQIAADIFYRVTKDFFKVSYAFDGTAILVTQEKIENNENVLEYANGEKKIIISYKHSYDIKDVNNFINKKYNGDIGMHLQCLDIISRGYQSQSGYVDRRKIFSKEGCLEINSILQIWTGLVQNFRVTKLGLVNNVDLAFQVMYENCSFLEFIVKLAYEGNDRRPHYSRYMDERNRNIRRGGNCNEDNETDETQRNEKFGGYNGREERGPRDDSSRDKNSLPPQGKRLYSDNRVRRGNYNDNRDGYGGNRNDRENNRQEKKTFESIYNNKELLNIALTKFKDLMKKIKLTTKHMRNGRNISFFAGDISDLNSTQIKFDYEGNKITVAEYFEKKYEKLTYPKLPLIVRKRKGLDDSYYPMEVLDLKLNQKFSKKLDDFQTSKMIRVAAKRPTDRFRIIEQKMREFKANNNPLLKEFNIVYDNNFLACKGKILPAPKLEYGPGQTQFILPINGSWNIRGLKALEAIEIKNWVFAYQSSIRINKNSIITAMQSLSAICKSFGVKLNTIFKIVEIYGPDDFTAMIESCKPAKFVLFLLGTKDSSIYSQIKKLSETTKFPVVTQCVLNSNFHKFNDPAFCSNIAMKINVKLKGKNWRLAIQNNPIIKKSTMVFGADVNHPGQGDLESPSIAAVTASIDLSHTTYSTTIQEQERYQEIIHGINEIVNSKLAKYISRNKIKPERIIFFRDGVGESQFYTVYENEILGIKEACKNIDPNYQPKLTYIIAQKRHSVRFELLNDSKGNSQMDSSKKSNSYLNRFTGNVTPGTVVDDISHPLLYDFYMVSQHALQGTARPIRYQVLLDENNFPVEEIQEIINNMCYQYPRATKAVSVVAPIYFAHLAAARAKCYVNSQDTEKPVPIEVNSHIEDQLFYM